MMHEFELLSIDSYWAHTWCINLCQVCATLFLALYAPVDDTIGCNTEKVCCIAETFFLPLLFQYACMLIVF